MRSRILLVASAAFLVSACIETLSPPNRRFGFITATTYGDGASGYVTAPTVTFYDKTNLQYLTPKSDSCFVAFYGVSGFSGIPPITVSGGDFVLTGLSGRSDTLISQLENGQRIYKSMLTLGIPFVPGDTLTVTVPGADPGFPQSSVSSRTSEPFTHDPVGVPAVDESLFLTWTPAPQPGSLMTFSLRYANEVSTGGENEQVFCAFTDDGTGRVPSNILTGWRNALDDLRSVRATRLRSSEVIVDGRTKLTLVSTFSRPLLDYDP